MTSRRFVEYADGEDYIHKTAWQVVKRQLKHAEMHPNGAQLDHLVALVFSSHTLEGYANFLGEKIAPDLWKNERETFRKTGLVGKLDALHSCCGLLPLDRGRRPGASVQDLNRLRNGIAHPRTKLTRTATEYAEGHDPPLFVHTWIDKFVTLAKARRTADDVEDIVERLHRAALLRFPYHDLSPDSLEGILSSRSTSSKLKT